MVTIFSTALEKLEQRVHIGKKPTLYQSRYRRYSTKEILISPQIKRDDNSGRLSLERKSEPEGIRRSQFSDIVLSDSTRLEKLEPYYRRL